MNLLPDFSKDRLSGKDIQGIRRILRFSQDRLSKSMDVSLSSICQWEQGRRKISEEMQVKLLTMFNNIIEYDIKRTGNSISV